MYNLKNNSNKNSNSGNVWVSFINFAKAVCKIICAGTSYRLKREKVIERSKCIKFNDKKYQHFRNKLQLRTTLETIHEYLPLYTEPRNPRRKRQRLTLPNTVRSDVGPDCNAIEKHLRRVENLSTKAHRWVSRGFYF